MFFKIEELIVQAAIAGVLYTQAQLLNQALNKIKKKGLFIQAVVAWNARVPNDKTLNNLKSHFTEAYDTHIENSPHGWGSKISWGGSSPQ